MQKRFRAPSIQENEIKTGQSEEQRDEVRGLDDKNKTFHSCLSKLENGNELSNDVVGLTESVMERIQK